MDLNLKAPDHTTISRRSLQLDVNLRHAAKDRPFHLIVDSTGLSIVGEGEWAAVKHGGSGKRAWKKLHLGVDRSGMIVAEVLTDGNADDSNAALNLIDKMKIPISSVTADAAYDTTAIYEAAGVGGAKVIVPSRNTATRSRRPSARDQMVRRVKEVGRRRWKKESGYHQQARVENTFFRYKSIIGDRGPAKLDYRLRLRRLRLRARHPESQEAESLIACNILNRVFEIGRPKSFAMKQPIRQAAAEIRAAFGFMHQRRQEAPSFRRQGLQVGFRRCQYPSNHSCELRFPFDFCSEIFRMDCLSIFWIRPQGVIMNLLRSMIRSPLAIAVVLIPWLALSTAASPTDPVTVEFPPMGQGDAFVPGSRLLEDLPGEYVEEEFLVSGAATLFNYAHNPPLGPTDLTAIAEDVPYKTRMIVRRPVAKGKFNGTVVIEWWNSTAGFDTAPAWDVSADYFARNGVVYVGVTNSTTSLDFLTGGCSLFGILPPTCGTRYSTLSLPENGLAYEMMSQIASLLKSDAADHPLPGGFDVERIYHTGQSQQGGSMVTYASAFHFDANDGYFVQQAATARSINFGPSCNDDGSPPYPDCTPRLVFPDSLVRTDLPVPVVHANTETDLEILFGTFGRQDDTPTFRYYEVAGGSHLTVHKDVEIVPAGLLGPDPLFLEDLCQFELNTTGDGPVFVSYVFNALWENLEEQVQDGTEPPAGVQMDVVAGVVQRDEFGNGLGGVRLPALDVPIATYTPGNVADPTLPPFLRQIGNLACFLASSVTPFDSETELELYPVHGVYVSQVVHAANQLRSDGFLLNADRQNIVRDAASSSIGLACGIGFELALILPPLMWLRQRRGKRSA